MAGLIIRRCEQADLPAVRELLLQLSEVAPAESGFAPDHLAAIFGDMYAAPGFYTNLVAAVDGQVRGFISVVFYKTMYHRGGTALINELVVDRQVRGMGVGRALIEAVLAEARDRGMDEVEVGTERDNRAAQDFYHRVGFDEEYVLLGLELGN